MCHTSDICVLCMVTSVTRSWPWTELNIKHSLNQCLALYFRSTRGKFWPKTDNFEVSTARNLKAPILTFDLTLTWHVTSFGKFRGCFRIVSSRAFKRRIVRLSAAIRSRVMTWGRLTPPPPPPASRGWRSTPANAGLIFADSETTCAMLRHNNLKSNHISLSFLCTSLGIFWHFTLFVTGTAKMFGRWQLVVNSVGHTKPWTRHKPHPVLFTYALSEEFILDDATCKR